MELTSKYIQATTLILKAIGKSGMSNMIKMVTDSGYALLPIGLASDINLSEVILVMQNKLAIGALCAPIKSVDNVSSVGGSSINIFNNGKIIQERKENKITKDQKRRIT